MRPTDAWKLPAESFILYLHVHEAFYVHKQLCDFAATKADIHLTTNLGLKLTPNRYVILQSIICDIIIAR